jgi:SAM-dependent methyltransferase
MGTINFTDHDRSRQQTPPELVGMYPMGGGGLIEAPYRHYFELHHLRKLIRFNRNMNILELGSGNGRWAVSLAPVVAHYTGVDFTPRHIQVAREAVAAKGISNAEFREDSVLSFKGDRNYDVIYFGSVSQYLEDDQIHELLKNLSRWIAPSTIMVERCTVSYSARIEVRKADYFSNYRTPLELDGIFRMHGFSLCYYKRSYRILRGGRALRRRYEHVLPRYIWATAPLSLWIMLGMSWLADLVKPVPWPNPADSHDFLIFKQGVERCGYQR